MRILNIYHKNCHARMIGVAKKGLTSEKYMGSERKISLPAPIQPDQEPERRRKAQWLYSQSVAATGTIVETYWQSRGISIKPAATIRYLPPKRGFHPAMIVPFGS